MEDIIDSFPEALFKDASPQSAKVGFHPDTKLACREGKVQGVMAKVVARGDSGVGKTDIIRYMRDVSERDSSTIGIDLVIKKYIILETALKMQIWDTGGAERYRTITSAYYRGSHAIMVVFDLCDPANLIHVRFWIEEARSFTKETSPDIFVVGNNKDKCETGALRDIREDAKALCGELNAEYWEVSVETGENIKELFMRIAAICFDKAVLRQIESADSKGGKVDVSKTGDIEMQTIGMLPMFHCMQLSY